MTRRAGNSRVLRLTAAPLKSPGWSGVKVFEVVMPSSRLAGNRSSGTTLRSGSGLGIRAPLSEVVVYRSPSPRTKTYFPSCTVTPLTRWTACPASLSGLLRICSAVTELTMLVALRCSSSARFTVPRSASALTAISASCTASAVSAMSCATDPPSRTTMPVTTLGPNPIIRARRDTGPAGRPSKT